MTRPRNSASFNERTSPWLEEVSTRQLSGDVRALEDFAALVRRGPGALRADPAGLARRRRRAGPAVERLLVWGRPWLETRLGLDWPLDLLREATPPLADACGPSTAPPEPGSPAWQPFLALALLPCPGGWRRLAGLERQRPRHPAVRAFLAREQARTLAKLRAKPDERFRLEHFCQVLAPPPPGGKGVLRVFSLPWLFLADGLLTALSRRWLFFVEPPMGLVFRHAWWRRFTELPEPALFGVVDPADLAHLRGQPGARPLALCHGDFLVDEPPPPAQSPRYDLVFNSSFDELERKRHRFFLRLLASPRLAGATALMLGRDRFGRSEDIRREAAALGLSDRLTIRTGLRRRDVPPLLRQGRVGVHLSLHENGPRCLHEFLRADRPVAVSACTAGVSPALFTPQTGRRAADGDMAAVLADMLARPDGFAPRRWFLAHPLVPLASGGRGRHADPDDYRRLRPHYEDILACFRAAGVAPVHAF